MSGKRYVQNVFVLDFLTSESVRRMETVFALLGSQIVNNICKIYWISGLQKVFELKIYFGSLPGP